MSQPRPNAKIPSNLEECFEELKKMLSAKELSEFKAYESTDLLAARYHMYLGAWIRCHWGLDAGWSELAEYFRKMGVWHPDDMSGLILASFWHQLNGTDMRFQEMYKYVYK